MVIPAGEANRALQSTRTAQRTFDRLDGTQIQRAGQLARQGHRTATAPVRYTQRQLMRPFVGAYGLSQDAAQRLLGPGQTTGKQVDNSQTARQFDDQTVRIVADGSGDVDEAFRRGVYRAADDDAIDSYSQLDRAVRQVDELDGAQQRRAKQLVSDTNGAGVKLVDELDETTLTRLLDEDGIDRGQLAHATRNYGELDGSDARQFRQLLDDDGLRQSWIRAAGDGEVSAQSVRVALKQVDAVSNDVSVSEFRAASTIDVDSDSYYSSWYDSPDNPYHPDTIVIDARAQESLDVYRFWDSGRTNHEAGPWATDARDIDRLRQSGDVTPDDIVNRYALPGDVDKVTRFDVDGGTDIRISEAGSNYGQSGGGVQYELRGENMQELSEQIDISDMPVDRDDPVDISEFLGGG